MKRSRNGLSEDSQFTEDEIEVADILILFRYCSKRLFLQWGAKRRRSGIQRDESSATQNSKLSPLDSSASENEHGGMAVVPPSPPACRLPSTYRPNSKKVRAKNRPGKRAPKKKTHTELTEAADELFLENARLIEEVEHMRKTHQGLIDDNVYLNSQLVLCLEQWPEKNKPCISQPSSSSHSDTGQKTETVASCDNFQSCDEHGKFEKFYDSSALGSTYDQPERLGRPVYPCSHESLFGSKKDGAMPTKDTICSGFLDLNVPVEALFGTNISNDHDQMPMLKNKAVAAARARRHRIELKRGKYPQLSKGRSRWQEGLNEKVL